MLRKLFVICALCLFALGNSLPIVISRYGGRSSATRHQYPTYSKINSCSAMKTQYKNIYAQDSLSFLDNSYNRNATNVNVCAIIGTFFMVLASFVCAVCVICFVLEIAKRIVRCVAFPFRP